MSQGEIWVPFNPTLCTGRHLSAAVPDVVHGTTKCPKGLKYKKNEIRIKVH